MTLQLGDRLVRFSCRLGCHVLHANFVVETLARGAAPVPPRCSTVDRRSRHTRKDSIETAVQADLDLYIRTAWMGRRSQVTRVYAAGGCRTDGTITTLLWTTTRYSFPGQSTVIFFGREESEAGVSRCTRSPKHSHGCHHHPRSRKAPAEP